MQPFVARCFRIQSTVHQIDRSDTDVFLVGDALARPHKTTQFLLTGALPDARQREVGPERPSLELESERFARRLDVMMQKLESRLALDTHPYDARASKVRERSHATELHAEWAMAFRHFIDRAAQVVGHTLRLLAKKLEREVDASLIHP